MKPLFSVFPTLLLTLACAFPALADKSNNMLDYASTKDIRDINPHLYSGEMAAQNMVFESLVLNTEKGVAPYLAERWDISPDGKSYTFFLRHDVTFSDGEPFNAKAVKLNIEAVLDNYERHAWLELVRQIDSVEIVDEFTVKLNLKNPYYPTLTELGLTRPFRFISPNSFINGKTKTGVANYIGTGPWVLTEHKKDQYAEFKVNPNYWGEKPVLNGVMWRVIPDRQTMLLSLQKGDIQLIFGADGDMLDMDSFEALMASDKFKTEMSAPIASRAIVLNSSRAMTSSQKVRQALQYAVDKEGIAQGILAGSEKIADTLMARSVPYCDFDSPTYAYQPTKAIELLEAEGWVLPKGKAIREKQGEKLQLLLSYNVNNAVEKEIAELIQDDFKKIGVGLTILGEEKQAYLDRQKNGDFDLQYSLSWGTPYDPASFVSSFRIPAHADYQGQKGLANKVQLDAMIGELLITPNEARRQELYKNLFTSLAEQAVYIPLTYSRTKAIHRSELENVGFNPSQYEIPFEKMRFKP
ncbi:MULTISPECIES: nickel ABC transporter substrate-binding protein [Proteus]|uniref:Nickel ABC transporter, nickel/metallophore periplasmic binding protein n=1 Tax=Proteus columbae TaxID=1987580 RepID=A0A6I7DHC5_9GAMM|nr:MULTISPECIES: nickel ABC transporter substrate-binding protein [Proteus]MBG2711656.1 nickel ABC transporter, nickel/metallophore periplasmic binding protein [Proteus mirabilis]MBG2768141.1 nickel ABC transporter, nickel/metallophore periplasmic binding protein [Proteus mirabilis]MBG2801960.1 nickel ABC transporter, nickel/metallophore periplasmic binding protein [Proteus mirabilis]MBG3019985.1 nickel ABC transporter, nickel/metallophore periplasmic binding protein [Proteus mirabilis]QHN1225